MLKTKISFESYTMNILFLAILMIPFWWVLGIRFCIFHLISGIIFLKLLFRRRDISHKVRIPFENWILIGFIGIYISSIILNLKTIPIPRLIGSLNNLSFWIIGALLCVVIPNIFEKKDIPRLLNTFSWYGLINIFFVGGAFVYWTLTKSYLDFKSVLLKFIPTKFVHVIAEKAPLFKAYLRPSVIGRDRLFGNEFPRSPGFNIYGTALGLTMVIVISMTIAHLRTTKNKVKIGILLFFEIVVLFLSLSRVAVLGLGLSLLIVFLLSSSKRRALITSGVLAGIIVLVMILIPPAEIIQTVTDFRGESTNSRLALYDMTFTQALNKPFLGHGFKPRNEDFPIPIGSHSMYMGVIYKTGFLGLLVFLFFWLCIIRKWWQQKNRALKDKFLYPLWFSSGVALFGGLIWMVTEDLDAPPIAAFLYFVIVGVILSLDRFQQKKT